MAHGGADGGRSPRWRRRAEEQGDGEDPEVLGGADGAGDRHGGVDPGGRGGAGATEERGGAEGMKEPDGAGGTKGQGEAGGVESRGESQIHVGGPPPPIKST